MDLDDCYNDAECLSSDESFAKYDLSHHVSTYRALNEDMKGRVLVEQESVWTHLKVDHLDNEEIHTCCKQLKVTCAEDISSLKNLAISPPKPDYGRPERHLYPLLALIFNFIENFTVSSKTTTYSPSRRFVQDPEVKFGNKTNPYMTGFPRISPDFQLKNITDNYDPTGKPRFWKDRDGFCAVEVESSDGPPTSENPDAYSVILSKSANYARLHMSARPFLLHSIGLLIYGRRFCVCIFDRAGVRISPERDMWNNLEDFVRVVRCLTCTLEARDIGQDPTVRLRKKPGEPDSYVIKPIGKETNSWCTIGSPIWGSLSLFGRGTFVWKVAEYDEESDELTGPTRIMKSAWRSAQHNPESSLCAYVTSIAKHHPEVSVAEFLTGGDVYVEGGSPPDMRLASEPSSYRDMNAIRQVATEHKTLITVPFLRRESSADVSGSPILHRVITKTVGRPLWEFKDDKELARGLIAVLKSLKKLCELNVLHGDISPGNILLAEDSELVAPGREAFLLDFELALVGDVVGAYVYDRVGPESERSRKPAEGGAGKKKHLLPGTLQFMALDILDNIVGQRRTVFKQQPHHDLESVVWVLGYILLRKLRVVASETKRKKEEEKLDSVLAQVFGRVKLLDIWNQRRLVAGLKWINDPDLRPFLNKHLSSKVANIVRLLSLKLSRLFSAKDEASQLSMPGDDIINPDQDRYKEAAVDELTHDYLIRLFGQII